MTTNSLCLDSLMNTLQKILLIIATMILSSHTLFSQSKPPRKSIELHYSELKLLGKTAVFEKNGLTKKVRDSVDMIEFFIDVPYADSICITPKDFKNLDKLNIVGNGYVFAELEGLQKFKNLTYLHNECVMFDYSKILNWEILNKLEIEHRSGVQFYTPKYKIEDLDIVFPKNLDTLIINGINSFDYDSEWFASHCNKLKYFRFNTNVCEMYLETETCNHIEDCMIANFYSDDYSYCWQDENVGVWVDKLELIVPYIKSKDIRCIANYNTNVYPISNSLIMMKQDTGTTLLEKTRKYGVLGNINELSFDKKYIGLEENCIVDINKSKFYGDSLVMYYRNGEIACRGQYKNGARCGIWHFYVPELEIMQKYYNEIGEIDSVLTPVQSIKSKSVPNGLRYAGRIDKEKYLDTMRTVAPPIIIQNDDGTTYERYWSHKADWYPVKIDNELSTYILLKDTIHNMFWEIVLANDDVSMAMRYDAQTMEITEYIDYSVSWYSIGSKCEQCTYSFVQCVDCYEFHKRNKIIEKSVDLEQDKQKDEFLNEVYKTLRYYGYL